MMILARIESPWPAKTKARVTAAMMTMSVAATASPMSFLTMGVLCVVVWCAGWCMGVGGGCVGGLLGAFVAEFVVVAAFGFEVCFFEDADARFVVGVDESEDFVDVVLCECPVGEGGDRFCGDALAVVVVCDGVDDFD